jgi:hypothetical protein
MKPSDHPQSETRLQHIEAHVVHHVRELFRRLPMLAGFWLRSDLDAEVSFVNCTGRTRQALYDEVMRSLVALAEERPEAVALMRGRTFARALH